MNNVSFVEVKTIYSEETMALIDRGNGEFTTMPKSTYDAQQEHLTENPTEGDE